MFLTTSISMFLYYALVCTDLLVLCVDFLRKQSYFPYPVLNVLGASSEVPCRTIYERMKKLWNLV